MLSQFLIGKTEERAACLPLTCQTKRLLPLMLKSMKRNLTVRTACKRKQRAQKRVLSNVPWNDASVLQGKGLERNICHIGNSIG